MSNSNVSLKTLFILDKETADMVDSQTMENELVFSYYPDFEKALDEQDQLKAIVVLAELNWEGLQEIFYGFEIACRLRRAFKRCCPIVITSSFDNNIFEALSEKKQEKFNILYGSGTTFLQLKELHEKVQANELAAYLDSLPSLSYAALNDMVEMLLQQKGFLIDKITHDLKFTLNAKELRDALDSIGSYLSSPQKNELEYADLSSQIIDCRMDNDEVAFNNAKENLQSVFERHLSENAEYKLEESEVSTGKVLIVEDDPEEREQIKDKLQDYFQLEVTGNGTEAIEILKKDTENKIIAVIADWRLLKYDQSGNKTRYWQDYQGYHVLEKAAQSHYAALFSLTAAYDKNVHQIRNQLGIAIQLFKKEHIHSSEDDARWRMFIEIIRDRCNDVVALVSSIPSGNRWKNKYEKDYRKKRLSVGWSSFEKEVSRQADDHWNYFKNTLDPNSRIGINMGLEDRKNPLNNLKNVLIGRRLFFALYYEFIRLRNDATVSFPPEQIIRIGGVEKSSAELDTYAALRNDWWESDGKNEKVEFEKYDQNARNLRTALCIILSVGNMLPEEKAWLTQLGVNYTIQKVKFETDLDETFNENDNEDQQETLENQEPTADDLKNLNIPSEEDQGDEIDI